MTNIIFMCRKVTGVQLWTMNTERRRTGRRKEMDGQEGIIPDLGSRVFVGKQLEPRITITADSRVGSSLP